jgi:hypothetical protein
LKRGIQGGESAGRDLEDGTPLAVALNSEAIDAPVMVAVRCLYEGLLGHQLVLRVENPRCEGVLDTNGCTMLAVELLDSGSDCRSGCHLSPPLGRCDSGRRCSSLGKIFPETMG